MSNNFVGNKLLEYFNVENHQQLMEHIKDNPDDIKVKEVKELLLLYGIDLGSELSMNE